MSMAGDSIDNMIVNFVGSVRQKTEVEDSEQGALGGFSLSEKNPEYSKNDSGAAKLLREKALLGWKANFPKSRKEPHWTVWGNFVKEHLDIKKIGKKRLEKIFQSAGLGISDDEKMIVVIAEEVEEKKPTWDEVLEDLSEEEVEEESSEEEGEPAPANPFKSRGPQTLDCGHINWYTDEANEKARAEGHCCAGKKNKATYDWAVRGLMYPIPAALRRGHARFDNAPSHAWVGYCCCPHTGLYIGGVANDCRYNPNGQRCVVHQGDNSRNLLGQDYKKEHLEQKEV